jgi:hypothetical protein
MASLSDHFARMFVEGLDADVTLIIGEKFGSPQNIAAHSFILRRAGYFEAAFAHTFKDSITREFTFEDVNPSHLHPLLKALYTDIVPTSADDLPQDFIQMLVLCRRFDFPEAIADKVLDILKPAVKWGSNTLLMASEALSLDLQKAVDALLSKVVCDSASSVRHELDGFQERAKELGPALTYKAIMCFHEKLMHAMQAKTVSEPNLDIWDYSVQQPQAGGNRYVTRRLCTEKSAKASVAKFREARRDNDKHADIWQAFFESSMHLMFCSKSDSAVEDTIVGRKRKRSMPRLNTHALSDTGSTLQDDS